MVENRDADVPERQQGTGLGPVRRKPRGGSNPLVRTKTRKVRDVTDKEWRELVLICGSTKQLIEAAGLNYSHYTRRTVPKIIRELGLIGPKYKRRLWTDEDLIRAVEKNTSMMGVLRDLGLKQAGGTNRMINQKIATNGLSTKHWLGQGHNRGKSWQAREPRPISEILVENSDYTNTRSLKKRLVNEGLLEKNCALCGINEWHGNPLVLRLDHINGTHWDNRIENLRLLCPNCDSQQPTFCRKKR